MPCQAFVFLEKRFQVRSMCLVIYPHGNYKTSGLLLECGLAVLSTSCCSEDQCQTAPLLALLASCVLCYPFDSMVRQYRKLSWYWKTILFFKFLFVNF